MVVEPVEAFLPEPAVFRDPIGDFPQRLCLEAAGAALGLASLRNQPRALQHLQVPGDGGRAHIERFGKILYRFLAGSEPCQNGASRRVGESGEGGVELR